MKTKSNDRTLLSRNPLTCLDGLPSSESREDGTRLLFWSLVNFNWKLSLPPPATGRSLAGRHSQSPLTEGPLLGLVNVGDGLESVQHHVEGGEEGLQPLDLPPGEALLLRCDNFILSSCWFSLLCNAENFMIILQLQEPFIDIQRKCSFREVRVVVLPPNSIAFQIS